MRSIDMPPYFARQNTGNTRSAQLVYTRNFPFTDTVRMQQADDSHVSLCNVCAEVLFAAWRLFWVLLKTCSALCCHISHVVIVGAKEQVIGANARGIVTTVQNPQSIGDGAIVQLPRYAMHVYRAAILANLPVPSGITCSCPFPTTIVIGFVYSLPKPWRNWTARVRAVIHRACLATVPLCGVFGRDGERVPAMSARCFAYNAHVDTSFLGVGHATGCYQQRGGFVMPALYHSLAHSGALNAHRSIIVCLT